MNFMLINILVSSDALRTLQVGILKFSGPLASDYGRIAFMARSRPLYSAPGP